MPEPLTYASAAFPLANALYKTVSLGFDIHAVPSQARDILTTIDQVRSDISFTRGLRRRTSQLLHQTEKDKIDETIANTEDALLCLAKLVEKPRVNMAVDPKGDPGFKARMWWVMMDGKNVPTCLARLNTVNMSLQTQILLMAGLERTKGIEERIERSGGTREGIPPPSYEATKETVSLRRESTRRRSARGSRGRDVSLDVNNELSRMEKAREVGTSINLNADVESTTSSVDSSSSPDHHIHVHDVRQRVTVVRVASPVSTASAEDTIFSQSSEEQYILENAYDGGSETLITNPRSRQVRVGPSLDIPETRQLRRQAFLPTVSTVLADAAPDHQRPKNLGSRKRRSQRWLDT